LARILGQEDRRDIRISRQAPSTIRLRSVRREQAEVSPDSPLVTMDGDVVGTPAYMSPEQARGELELMGPPSDVYAVGAMLYHLLVGHAPYMKPGMKLTNYAILYRLQDGPPETVHTLVRDPPAELIAICEKAMAREWRARYRDMGELAHDLRAYLEHRVVRAYQTGAVAEFRKWVDRNRHLASVAAAGLLALVAGLVVSSVLFVRAEEATREARSAAIRSTAVQDLFTGTLQAATEGANTSLRDWLDVAATEIDETEDKHPAELRVEIETMIIQAYTNLLVHSSAYHHGKHALELLDGYPEISDEVRARALIAIAENIIRMYSLFDLDEEPVTEELLQEATSALEEALTLMHKSERPFDVEIRQLEGSLVYLKVLQSDDTWPREAAEYIAGIWRRSDVDEVKNELNEHTKRIVELWNEGRHEEAKQIIDDDAQKYMDPKKDRTFYAAFLRRMGNWALRKGMYSFAEAILSKSSDVARREGLEIEEFNALGDIAVLYQRTGRESEALTLLEGVCPLLDQRLGPTEKIPCRFTRLRADCLARLGRLEESLTMLRDLRQACIDDLGPETSELVPTLRAMAGVLLAMGRAQEAEAVLVEAVAVPTGESHSEKSGRARALTELADIQISLGRFWQAEEALKLAWSELRGLESASLTATQECRATFVDLYEAWGKPGLAEAWR
jgi:tetratricopeptide (TPR) repeat protein